MTRSPAVDDAQRLRDKSEVSDIHCESTAFRSARPEEKCKRACPVSCTTVTAGRRIGGDNPAVEPGIERPEMVEKRFGDDFLEVGGGSVICVAAKRSETRAMVFLSSSMRAFASRPWPMEQAVLANWAVLAMLGGRAI